MGDPLEHGEQGLIGALIVETADATALLWDPATQQWNERWHGGLRARVRRGDGSHFQEFVLLYQDGLNLRWQGTPLSDCLICDDSYDRGEKAVSYRAAPFWARLLGTPQSQLNAFEFPARFFDPAWKPIATPAFTAAPGERVVFRVVHPAGRARQRAFMVYGHDYPDLLPRFGSAHSVLMAPGKGVSAWLDESGTDGRGGVHAGRWLWRDGPAQHFSSGVWGVLEVR